MRSVIPRLGLALIGDLVLTAVGVTAAAVGVKLGVGTLAEPQAGFMPLCAGTVLAVLGAIGLLPRRAKGDDAPEDSLRSLIQNPRDWLVTVFALIGLLVGVKYLGFVPVTLAFMFLLHAVSGPWQPLRSLAYATLVTGACWVVFSFWFKVPF